MVRMAPHVGRFVTRLFGVGVATAALAGETSFEIEAFGRSYLAKRGPRCLYDAKMERLKS